MILIDFLENIANHFKGTPNAPKDQPNIIDSVKAISDNIDASESHPGIVEFATDAEAAAKTATDKAVTPANLAGVTVSPAIASDAEALAKTLDTKALSPANLAAIGATATFAGLIELATDAETQTGSATDRAVTPANLTARTATATRTGIAELATAAEALAGTDTDRIVTPAGLEGSIGSLNVLAFAGKNGAGACTLTGIKVGDKVLSVTGVAAGTVGSQSSKFETTITVADQIQQSDAGNLSANIYLALVYRKS